MTEKRYLKETGISEFHLVPCKNGYIPLHKLLNKFMKANKITISNEQIKTDFYKALRHKDWHIEDIDSGLLADIVVIMENFVKLNNN